jgi:SecD/SecF fusion protein
MQGKGIVKFFLVAMTLVCLVQYLFLLPTNKVERAAESFAKDYASNLPEEQQAEAEKSARMAYLDSMSSEVVLNIPLLKKYTYTDLKKQQLALGLDLKGGMSVVLQVDLREFLRALANDSKDPTFVAALDQATEALKTSQSDYITLFADAWRQIDGSAKMADVFESNESLRDLITANTSNGEMTRILREKGNETVGLTFKLLKERIDKLGVAQPNISLDPARDLILVELPGIDNPERARAFLSQAAKLEFWDVYRIIDPGVLDAFSSANERLRKTSGNDVDEEPENQVRFDTIYAVDNLGNVDSSSFRIDTIETTLPPAFTQQQGPLFDIFRLNQTGEYGLAVMGTAEKNKRNQVMEFLTREDIRSFFPRNMSFHWSKDPARDPQTGAETRDIYQLFAIQIPQGRSTALLEGDRVVDAQASPDPQTGEMGVSLRMDQSGARTWAQMTTKAAQDQNREIAIVLDGEVVSAPRVINPIPGGNSSITGNFTTQEAKDLANILQVGKLPATPRIIQENLVGPSLGKDNINRSVTAMIVGFLTVLAFMVLYYGTGGVVSIMVLFLNLFFIFGALASIGTVLTLPGIAGIVLTIGMAVDANVIIFERIREELREGKSMLMSVQDGFANSYSAIIDANVTTIFTAIVLAYFGLGPIKGFAVVLIIGVIFSLFTAVLVGRLIFEWWLSKGRSLTFGNSFTFNTLSEVNIDWLGMRKIGYAISGTIILAGMISFFVRGFDLGVDFKGGYSYNVEFAQAVKADDIRTAMASVFGKEPTVKAVDTENTYNIVTDFNIESTDDDAADLVLTKLHEGLNTLHGGSLSFDDFKNTEGKGKTHITSSTKVGPSIAEDIKKSSFESAIFALLLIFLYLFIRFNRFQYSLGAVAALFHDVLITLGIFSLLHGIVPWSMEIDQAFIAAILTVIGYSINDTVVVFDRIREFLNLYTGQSKKDVINKAVNTTLSRTLLTSMTTLFVVAVLFIFGGGSIKGFAFALIIGVLVGTYSSIFIATPVVFDSTGDDLSTPKKVKEQKGFSKSRA